MLLVTEDKAEGTWLLPLPPRKVFYLFGEQVHVTDSHFLIRETNKTTRKAKKGRIWYQHNRSGAKRHVVPWWEAPVHPCSLLLRPTPPAARPVKRREFHHQQSRAEKPFFGIRQSQGMKPQRQRRRDQSFPRGSTPSHHEIVFIFQLFFVIPLLVRVLHAEGSHLLNRLHRQRGWRSRNSMKGFLGPRTCFLMV